MARTMSQSMAEVGWYLYICLKLLIAFFSELRFLFPGLRPYAMTVMAASSCGFDLSAALL